MNFLRLFNLRLLDCNRYAKIGIRNLVEVNCIIYR